MVLMKSNSTGKNVENWVLITSSAPKVQLGVVQCPVFFFFTCYSLILMGMGQICV
jgi:hypothetical protein